MTKQFASMKELILAITETMADQHRRNPDLTPAEVIGAITALVASMAASAEVPFEVLVHHLARAYEEHRERFILEERLEAFEVGDTKGH
jgi:hypothetical protein